MTLADLGVTSQTREAGRHRVVTARRTAMPVRIGAVAAIAGAIGLAGATAGEVAAKPSSPITLPDGVKLPENLKVPKNLPQDLDNALRDLLPRTGQGRAVKPASGTVTSNYGARWGAHHDGIDIANKTGTPVYAVTDGVVLEAGPASGYGQWIRVRQDDGTTAIFGHVEQIFVNAGEKVHAGEKIGTVGSRGNSTGPHLHYEVHNAAGAPINPHTWLAKRGVQP
ncbi:M23 family metallopeptidase [Gordonia sp. HY002]|uniref:M23 family metallopeptidase n=1 Tax=Gordonia zhenghanii TaxID=2911516 RepID=UPI001EF04A9B|nr:M23 family metallopeptidase [Gordonia zhenghanii]MCF8571234.1 M23 family metallopeptidase [Gordonia zhenghanii]MCF8601758.1 M23 family metallopeptidase [Gordonia zhenghanii]